MTWTAIDTWKTEMKEWWTLYWYENDTLQELVLCCLTPDSLLTSCFEMSFSIGMDAGSAPNSHLWFPEIYELEDSASSFCLSVWTYCLSQVFSFLSFLLFQLSSLRSNIHANTTDVADLHMYALNKSLFKGCFVFSYLSFPKAGLGQLSHCSQLSTSVDEH